MQGWNTNTNIVELMKNKLSEVACVFFNRFLYIKNALFITYLCNRLHRTQPSLLHC